MVSKEDETYPNDLRGDRHLKGNSICEDDLAADHLDEADLAVSLLHYDALMS